MVVWDPMWQSLVVSLKKKIKITHHQHDEFCRTVPYLPRICCSPHPPRHPTVKTLSEMLMMMIFGSLHAFTKSLIESETKKNDVEIVAKKKLKYYLSI